MSSLFLAHERNQLFRRLENLTAERKTTNGVASGHDTLIHLKHDLDIVLGDAPTDQRGSAWSRSAGRWLVLNFVPWPEKVPSHADQLSAFVGNQPKAADFSSDFAAYVEALKRFDARCQAGSLPPHPVYGNLSRDDWGKYMYLHMDWHLSTLQI